MALSLHGLTLHLYIRSAMPPMNSPDSTFSTSQSEPLECVHRDGVQYVILGTAHISRQSMDAVETLLAENTFDAVAVELCASRAQSIRNPENFKQMDLFQIIRQGKTGMVAASLILSSFQKRLADQYNICPGAEMKAAIDGADARNLPTWLVDRDLGITLKRAWQNQSFWKRFGLFSGLLAAVFERTDVNADDIEKLKQGDMLESAITEFTTHSPTMYHSLIAERDAYMAARLRTEARSMNPGSKVLVVVGAGHLSGLCKALSSQQNDPEHETAKLSQVMPRARWPKWLAIGFVLLVFIAIGITFHHNTKLGMQALRDWVLYTGGLAVLGALLARAHPVSVLAALIAAPIKPFRPGIPAGGISAMAEAWVRRPRVADFDSLRDDITHWRGWWKNRVARTLLNFFLVNLGTIIGEYSAGLHIVHRLL